MSKELESRNDVITKNVAPLEEEDQEKRGWVLTVNGVEVPGVSSVVLDQKKMGIKIEYGKTPLGYDGPAIEEAGGGGSVIVPCLVIDGQLYIGVVEENRPNAGGKILNVPRGFLNPGETHFETAKRELAEEAGYVPMDDRIRKIDGVPMNPNGTYFVTKGEDKGVKSFAVEVKSNEVNIVNASENPIERVFGFNEDAIKPISNTGKKVMKSKFIHWTKAMLATTDMFTVAAVGRLVTSQLASQAARPTSSAR